MLQHSAQIKNFYKKNKALKTNKVLNLIASICSVWNVLRRSKMKLAGRLRRAPDIRYQNIQNKRNRKMHKRRRNK